MVVRSRKSVAVIIGALAVLFGVLPQSAKADEVLKVGTLAPKQSMAPSAKTRPGVIGGTGNVVRGLSRRIR